MYVKWKRREAKRSIWRGKIRKYAVLVESYRNEDGKPRQRYIKHLGGIVEGCEEYGLHPVTFWDHVLAKLDELDLSETERHKIVDSIARVVPVPSDEYREKMDREFKAFTGALKAMLNR